MKVDGRPERAPKSFGASILVLKAAGAGTAITGINRVLATVLD
jgi:hypothetical protein